MGGQERILTGSGFCGQTGQIGSAKTKKELDHGVLFTIILGAEIRERPRYYVETLTKGKIPISDYQDIVIEEEKSPQPC